MTYTAAVSGATGYAGGEVLRLLAEHPEIEVTTLAAGASAGTRFGQLAPHLPRYAHLTVQETAPEVLSGHDVVFLALPHGASAEVAAALPEDAVVVDAGADHRLEDPDEWERFYGTAHAGHWPYGLPELLTGPGRGEAAAPRQRETLRTARRIAVPGCYPTAVQLALAPGLAAGILEPRDLVVVAASGTSGAGRSAKPHLLGSEVMGSMSPYGAGGVHRHVPEIRQGLSRAAGAEVTLSFTPTLAPMPRGILATATARLSPGVDPSAVRAVWEEAYAGEPFARLLPEGLWPATQNVQGANAAHLQLAVDEAAGRVVVVCAIDNLVKGTAGGAIQSVNLALGLPETTGLPQEGLAP